MWRRAVPKVIEAGGAATTSAGGARNCWSRRTAGGASTSAARLEADRSRRGGTPDDAVADLGAALLRARGLRRPGGRLLADGLVGVAVEPARPEVTVLGGRGLLVDPGLVRLRPGADARCVVVPVVVLVARVEAARPRRVFARRGGTGGRQRNAGAGRCLHPSNRLLSRGRALGTITQARRRRAAAASGWLPQGGRAPCSCRGSLRERQRLPPAKPTGLSR